MAAGLLIKSFVRLQQVELGYRTDHVLAMDLALPETGYPANSPALAQFYEQLLTRVRALPGVKSAGTSVLLPLTRRSKSTVIRDMSRPEPEPGKEDRAEVRVVSQGFLEALRIPLGRTVELGLDFGKGDFGGVVVGIVGSTRFRTPTQDVGPEAYVPFAEA